LAILAFAEIPSALAAPARQDATPVPNAQECVGCHEGVRAYWEESAHGYALVDPDFQRAWTEQGSPQECLACHTTGFDAATGEFNEGGVGCLTCHSPVPANHPDAYMPTDVSSRLCGQCHVDTFAEWEISEHGQQGMTCNQCHNPHTADLKAEHSQELCMSCHNTEGHYYSFTGHAQEGLLCTDCHLTIDGSAAVGEPGHGRRQHTFKVDLTACNACHLDDMHPSIVAGDPKMITDPAELVASAYPVATETAESATATTGVTAAPLPPTPTPTVLISATPHGPSPFVYVIPAGFGLVFGVLLAPWLERLTGRRKDGEG
jgi:predicted CXXCH cytochrome family protein